LLSIDAGMAALYLFLSGWVALIVLAVLTHFSGRLAARLQLYAMAAMGAAFLASAVFLLISDPWTPPERGIPPTGVHRPGDAAIYGVLVFVAYAGPQITGLVLAAIALYILNTVRVGYRRLK
jgi:hypothetical protein